MHVRFYIDNHTCLSRIHICYVLYFVLKFKIWPPFSPSYIRSTLHLEKITKIKLYKNEAWYESINGAQTQWDSWRQSIVLFVDPCIHMGKYDSIEYEHLRRLWRLEDCTFGLHLFCSRADSFFSLLQPSLYGCAFSCWYVMVMEYINEECCKILSLFIHVWFIVCGSHYKVPTCMARTYKAIPVLFICCN